MCVRACVCVCVCVCVCMCVRVWAFSHALSVGKFTSTLRTRGLEKDEIKARAEILEILASFPLKE